MTTEDLTWDQLTLLPTRSVHTAKRHLQSQDSMPGLAQQADNRNCSSAAILVHLLLHTAPHVPDGGRLGVLDPPGLRRVNNSWIKTSRNNHKVKRSKPDSLVWLSACLSAPPPGNELSFFHRSQLAYLKGAGRSGWEGNGRACGPIGSGGRRALLGIYDILLVGSCSWRSRGIKRGSFFLCIVLVFSSVHGAVQLVITQILVVYVNYLTK